MSATSGVNSWLNQTLSSLEQQRVPICRDLAYRLLQACNGEKKHIATIRRIQSCIVKGSLDNISALGDCLIRLFAACGSLPEANRAFRRIKDPSEFSWTSIILANSRLGNGEYAISLYNRMQHSNIKTNRCIYLAGLKACVTTSFYIEGMLIHDEIVEEGMDVDVVVGSALIDMYGKCGCVNEAHNVFDKLASRNLVSWNTLIAGYTLQGNCVSALELFERMQEEGLEPDKATYSNICKACGSVGAVNVGQVIHDQILKHSFDSDLVIRSSLVDMYAKCGRLEEGRKVFDEASDRDEVSWHAMIAGYAAHERATSALELFEESQPDGSYSTILKACGKIGAIIKGMVIHSLIIKNEVELDVAVGSALVDMYAKCGSLYEAGKVFDALPARSVVSWGALIAGYARAGQCVMARHCLDKMHEEGIKPNDIIFSSLLAACANRGLVSEGRAFFTLLRDQYEVAATDEHYVCMVDLLSRSGLLVEAEDLLQKTQSNIDGWMSLLTACKLHGKVEIGRRCFEQVIHANPDLPAAYDCMYDIYMRAGMREEADQVQSMRHHTNVWKKPGRAWIELNKQVYEFVVGEGYHVQVGELLTKQKHLRRQMQAEGYKPQLESMMQSILKEGKMHLDMKLCYG